MVAVNINTNGCAPVNATHATLLKLASNQEDLEVTELCGRVGTHEVTFVEPSYIRAVRIPNSVLMSVEVFARFGPSEGLTWPADTQLELCDVLTALGADVGNFELMGVGRFGDMADDTQVSVRGVRVTDGNDGALNGVIQVMYEDVGQELRPVTSTAPVPFTSTTGMSSFIWLGGVVQAQWP